MFSKSLFSFLVLYISLNLPFFHFHAFFTFFYFSLSLVSFFLSDTFFYFFFPIQFFIFSFRYIFFSSIIFFLYLFFLSSSFHTLPCLSTQLQFADNSRPTPRKKFARYFDNITCPCFDQSSNRSLFIFSKSNVIRQFCDFLIHNKWVQCCWSLGFVVTCYIP